MPQRGLSSGLPRTALRKDSPHECMAGALIAFVMLSSSLDLFAIHESASTFPCMYKDGNVCIDCVDNDNLSAAASEAAGALQTFAAAMGAEATDALMCHVLQVCLHTRTAYCRIAPPRPSRRKRSAEGSTDDIQSFTACSHTGARGL